ncbi:unnamed protein product [Effrenium voratum]|uniref:Glycosyl transferase family 25 domain-containing protein n=1 Tax=Effrenium voratum TaxID=2562239 RepID=A0AA36HYY0_9DINO|nr:unnamed protein product [Effrenium voratum]
MDWLRGVADDFRGSLHIAVGNEPDRSGVFQDRVVDVIKAIKAEIPEAQVTVPFAYSIMHRSHPVEKSKLEKEFIDRYKDVLPLLDYFTINIYPFLSSGTRGVAMDNLTGPEMNFLNDQISALRIALDRDFPHNNLPLAVGETGWPSCGAASSTPYSYATLPFSERFVKNVALWMESSLSDGRIISGQLFTAFDEETKGTRPSERYYGILTSKGEEMDGSLCSFQQYLYDRWASCPPTARIPGDFVPVESHMVYAKKMAQTKCWSQRLADKYSDRGAVSKPNVSHLTAPHNKQAKAPSDRWDASSSEVSPLPDRFVAWHGVCQPFFEAGIREVFWINLEQSKDRRTAMEKMFSSLRQTLPASLTLQVVRVPAVTAEEVKAMQQKGALAVEAKLIDACTDACPQHHARSELLYTEMACSLSHLRAIEQALAGNSGLALMMEDDIEIYPEFGADLERLLAQAPEGWSALQMSTVSTKAILQLASSGVFFQPRERHFYGTGCLGEPSVEATRHFQAKPGTPGADSLQDGPPNLPTVIVADASEDGKCPGLESFRELRQMNVRMLYRVSRGRFSKWVYYTEDVEQFANYDFLMVFDADMGLSSFPWADYFRRYEDYTSKWGIAPVTGSVRNRSPFYPLKAEWWTRCNRTRIRFVETDLIEQWFAMLTGSFATWLLG